MAVMFICFMNSMWLFVVSQKKMRLSAFHWVGTTVLEDFALPKIHQKPLVSKIMAIAISSTLWCLIEGGLENPQNLSSRGLE